MLSKIEINRFIKKIDIESGGPDGCWPWTAYKGNDGYGQFSINRSAVKSHRVSYEYFYGVKIPDNLYIDHICRNRRCVRPDHLRLVTKYQNSIENSNGICAINIKKTHCKRGHPLINGNIYYRSWGGRECRMCNIQHSSRWQKENKNYLNEKRRTKREMLCEKE